MREDYSTVSIKSEDNVEPLPDEPKLTERSDDYVIFPKEELHLKTAERSTQPYSLTLEFRNLPVSEFHIVCQQISDVQQG